MVDVAQTFPPLRRDRLPIGGTLSATFRIFGKAPLVFLSLGLLSQLVVLGRLLVDPPTKAGFSVAEGVVLVGTFLLSFLSQTAMIATAVRIDNGQAASVREALTLAVRRYLPIAATTLLYVLATYAGLILLIVPGVIVSLIFAVSVQVCALESAGPIASLKRSAALTKGERWRILGVYCLFFLPLIILSGLIAFAVTMRGHLVAGQLCSVAVQIVWIPLAAIFSTVIYVELRRLKENVGVARIFD